MKQRLKTILSALLLGIAVTSTGFCTPSALFTPVNPPTGQVVRVFEDQNYKLLERHYGSKDDQKPGLFVFSKATKSWMQITEISTRGAKLGRSPRFEELKYLTTPVWDYSSLSSVPYASLPLKTSSSINLPKGVVYSPEQETYALLFNSEFRLESVLSVFYIRKADMDEAFNPKFEMSGGNLAQSSDR